MGMVRARSPIVRASAAASKVGVLLVAAVVVATVAITASGHLLFTSGLPASVALTLSVGVMLVGVGAVVWFAIWAAMRLVSDTGGSPRGPS